MVSIAQRLSKRLANLRRVRINLTSKSKHGPIPHVAVSIARESDQSANRPVIFVSRQSKNHSFSYKWIGVTGMFEKIRDR